LPDGDVVALADWKATFHALREAFLGNIESAMVPPRSMAPGLENGCEA